MPNEEMGSRALSQPPDVANRAVLLIVGGFLVFVAIAIAGLLGYLKARAPGAFVPRAEHPFPQPALQKGPQKDLGAFEAAQHAQLSGYGWIDREHGIARIPIDEAMRVIVGRGEQAYDPLPDAAPAPAGRDRGSR